MMLGTRPYDSMLDLVSVLSCMDMVTKTLSPSTRFAIVSMVTVVRRLSSKPENSRT
jgi:hypothetical protein